MLKFSFYKFHLKMSVKFQSFHFNQASKHHILSFQAPINQTLASSHCQGFKDTNPKHFTLQHPFKYFIISDNRLSTALHISEFQTTRASLLITQLTKWGLNKHGCPGQTSSWNAIPLKKLLHFDSCFTEVCSSGFNWQVSIGSGNGLVPQT